MHFNIILAILAAAAAAAVGKRTTLCPVEQETVSLEAAYLHLVSSETVSLKICSSMFVTC